jgi:hypothetical protein
MAHRNLSNLKQANLSINNKTLRIDNPYIVYHIPNIASVDKVKKEPGQDDFVLTLLHWTYALSFGCAAAMISMAFSKSLMYLGGSIVLMLIGILSCRGWIKRKENNIKFGVIISTNDAKTIAIYDRNARVIDDIISKLYEVMENQEQPISYHFRLEGDVVQQFGNFGVGINRGRIN